MRLLGKKNMVICPNPKCGKTVKKKASCSECGSDLTGAQPADQKTATSSTSSSTPSAVPAVGLATTGIKRLTIAVARAGTKDNPVEAWAVGGEAHKWVFDFEGAHFVVPAVVPWPFVTQEFAEITLGVYDCADDPNWAPTIELGGLMLFWGQRISHRIFKVVVENGVIAIADMGRSVQPVVGRLDSASGLMNVLEVPVGGSLSLEHGDKVLVGGSASGIEMELVIRIRIEDATGSATP